LEKLKWKRVGKLDTQEERKGEEKEEREEEGLQGGVE